MTAVMSESAFIAVVQHISPLTVGSRTSCVTTAERRGTLPKFVAPDLTQQADKWPLGTQEGIDEPPSVSRLPNVTMTRVSLTYLYGQWGGGRLVSL